MQPRTNLPLVATITGFGSSTGTPRRCQDPRKQRPHRLASNATTDLVAADIGIKDQGVIGGVGFQRNRP